MKLTETQKKALADLFSHPEVQKIMREIQLFSFVNKLDGRHLNQHSILVKATKKIKKVIQKKENSIQLDLALRIKLPDIIKQTSIWIIAQRGEYIDHYVSRCYRRYCQKLSANFTPVEELRDLIFEALQSFGFTKNRKEIRVLLLLSTESMQKIQQMHDILIAQKAGLKRYRLVAVLGLVYCAFLGVDDYTKNQDFFSAFQMRNTMMILLSVCLYKFLAGKIIKHSTPFFGDGKQLSLLPPLDFDLIDIVDQKTHSVEKTVMAPMMDAMQVEAAAVQAEPAPINKSSKSEAKCQPPILKQKKVKQRRPKSVILPPLKAPKSVSWPASAVLFGDAKSDITLQQVTEICGSFVASNVRYFAFFNTTALAKMRITVGTEEYESYKKRVETGKFVAPKGSSGIVNQKPRKAVENFSLGGQRFGRQIFSFKAKSMNTTYRLLARVCATHIGDSGNLNKLVDFCWHWPKGPGH